MMLDLYDLASSLSYFVLTDLAPGHASKKYLDPGKNKRILAHKRIWIQENDTYR